jgi:hypothetical protein
VRKAPKKKWVVGLRGLREAGFTEPRTRADLFTLLGGVGGLLWSLLVRDGYIFPGDLQGRVERLAWLLSKEAVRSSREWRLLPKTGANGESLRYLRAITVYNAVVAPAIDNNYDNFKTKCVQALKNARLLALETVHTVLDGLHSRGTFALLPEFYELCMGPLDVVDLQQALDNLDESDADALEAAQADVEATFALEKAAKAPSQRLLELQGLERSVEEGLLNAVCAKPPAGAAGVDNPIALLTPLAAVLGMGARGRFFEAFPTFAVGAYAPVLRDFEDPAEGKAGERAPRPCPAMYYFALLAAAAWLKGRSLGTAPPFSAKSFHRAKLWEAVGKWHRRLAKDLPYMGIEPWGGDTPASWGLVETPAAQQPALKQAFSANVRSPQPAMQKVRRKRGSGKIARR